MWRAFVLLAVIADVSYLSFRLEPRVKMDNLAARPAVLNYLASEKEFVRFWPVSTESYLDNIVHPLVGMNLPLNLPGTQSPLGYWRVVVFRNAKLINLIAPGYLHLDEKGLFDGLDLGKPRDPQEIDEGDLYWLRLLNVGNIISHGAQLHVPGLEPNGSAGDIYFYRVSDPLPRYFLVPDIERYVHGDAVLARIARKDWDPKLSALVEAKIPFTRHTSNPGRVDLKYFAPGKWMFKLSLPMAQVESSARIAQYFLVVGETYIPGWRAFSGGREIKVFRADYNFMGIPFPPGQYDVSFVYQPVQTRIALWAGLGAACFWLLLGAGIAVKRGLGQSN